MDIEILLLIVVPLATAFLIPLIDLISTRLRRILIFFSSITEIYIILSIFIKNYSSLKAGNFFLKYNLGGWSPPFGINLAMDSLSLLFSLIVTLALFMIVIFSIGFIGHHEGKYYVLFFLVIASIEGALLTGDIFNLYVFIEMMTISTAPLVAFKRSQESTEASIKYLFYGITGGVFFFIGVILIYFSLGTLNMAEIARDFDLIDSTMKITITAVFMLGMLIKLGIFPFHYWLPKAHSACPASISAVLSGILLKVYLYIFIRIFWTMINFNFLVDIHIAPFILDLALVSSILGHIFALQADDLKRMLAFSSIGHIGMILAVVMLNTEAGFYGGLLHIISHMLMKSGLFTASGYLLQYTISHNIDDFKGVGYRNRLLFISFIILSLSMIGMPPLIGFVSKWYVLMAFLKARHFFGAFIVIFGSLTAVVYYLRYISKAYEEIKLTEDDLKREIFSRPLLSVFYREKIVTSVVYIFTFLVIFFGIGFKLFDMPIKMAAAELTNPQRYIDLINLGG